MDPQGDLLLHTAAGVIRQQKPVLYQEIDGVRKEISGGYLRKGKHQVSFQIAVFDANRPLVIDPVLFYSTYLGGGGDEQGNGIAVDTAGNAYVTGFTNSTNFPTTVGAFQTTLGSFEDAFVTKLNPTGSGLIYSTYLGGSDGDEGFAIAVDTAGNAYVTGTTLSTNFPVTLGAVQPTFGGGTFDAFVTKLNATGSGLVYSTYLGGSNGDHGRGIAVDTTGNAYVTGFTFSGNFPITLGAFQTTQGGSYDAFVTKLNPAGSGLVYSTFLGGSGGDQGLGIAVDTVGNAYVTGATFSANFPITPGAVQPTLSGHTDAFVTKLNPIGSTPLVYSTYLGGSSFDEGNGIAGDTAGNAYVTGSTASSNFPTTPGTFQTTLGSFEDAFVTKLDPIGSGLVYSTYLGGNGNDQGNRIVVDTAGNAYVTGATDSTNFPTTSGAFQTTFGGGDAFVTRVNPLGTGLDYSTYLGGSDIDFGFGIALDALPNPNVYVTGITRSTDFLTTSGAFQTTFGGGIDAFVTKLNPTASALIGPPATLRLSPIVATNTVGARHCVTATVKDAFGNPTPGVSVVFNVVGAQATFSTPSNGTSTTNSIGQATFCFTASLPGDNVIHAFADSNNNGKQDFGEPFGDANKTWIPPAGTQFCEVIITDGGWIIANNGDQANFGGNAKVLADGTLQGQQQYTDQGPVQPLAVKSIQLMATTCDPVRTMATIFGTATINGAGSHVFRIDVTDNMPNTYGIMLDTGYMSGQHALGGGQITTH
ncbi:MAG TPA: SBBP repeat-containing protein [Acidobacteriota bacterium]|nr:SBBP repeat-containing protein [Acidobacteriota bacterium]